MIILCLTIATLWTATTVDMVVFMISTQSTLQGFLVTSADKIWTASSPVVFLYAVEPGWVADLPLQDCASTIALTLNVRPSLPPPISDMLFSHST